MAEQGEPDDHCGDVLRQADRDRFIASLFADPARRGPLRALWAFDTETARIRDVVSQPLPGEIRLQWWREVIDGERADEAAAHPVARALIAAIEDSRLPREPFAALLEARIFDLYDDPMPLMFDLETYLGETVSAVIRLASLVLAAGEDPGFAAAAGHAGLAIGITRLLFSLPRHAARGQCYLPVEILARHGARREDLFERRATPAVAAAIGELVGHARRHLAAATVAGIPPAIRPAFLPLALVGPALARFERGGGAVLSGVSEPSAWRRQLRLWRAARFGI